MNEPGLADEHVCRAHDTQGKLLCVSSNAEEFIRVVQNLLQAGVRCVVREGKCETSHEVWVHHEDFLTALRIKVDYFRPRPLPPWAIVLESLEANETKQPNTAAPARKKRRRRAKARRNQIQPVAVLPIAGDYSADLPVGL